VPSSADLILRTLETLGFEWDAAVLWQSTRTDAYQQALQTLINLLGLAACTRSELRRQTPPMPNPAMNCTIPPLPLWPTT
jgi:glutamyl-Q tRNA(Asp) synthetase